MTLLTLTPRQAVNKAYLRMKPSRSEIEGFKMNLIDLIDKSNLEESEEFHKNLISSFLRKTYYDPHHYINTKGRKDLVVHNGPEPSSSVGVIIEAKKPTNKAEMVRAENINVKSLHELMLYYLRERFSASMNLEVRHLIITNAWEWFIFDANTFEKEFAGNKELVRQFKDFEAGRLSGTNTEFFYREIAAPAIAKLSSPLKCACFDIRDYEEALRNRSQSDDGKLVPLYKLLSPQHLLKLPFANDSNTLHRGFYTELLHIIGLSETTDGSKRLITRKSVDERDDGSLLESAINQIDSLDKLDRVTSPERFGRTREERHFAVALELTITWVNRILFMKLLEAQLVSFHRGDASYRFMNAAAVPDFDALNTLFFQVLAREPDTRTPELQAKYAAVPYLNSSLFEPTELEHEAIFISSLPAAKQIGLLPRTVLKKEEGRKRTGELPALQYILDFLDAYDFSSESVGEIQEDSKSLISASVLGLIFEKINGYKDGSFFTPGFITMHMCRDVVRRAVITRFNSEKGWNCSTVGDLYDRIEDVSEANSIINSVRICDPAVGSGHFLVSALNELIALKADLRILRDREGRRLKEYNVEVVNDELTVTDEDGRLFSYHPNAHESQRVQEALFHEKETLIQGCLFGVDVNPNSAKICRLRLWIELLKNAYYKPDGSLETLPNIDINIKCGNSLISRFSLDSDLGALLKRKKIKMSDYRSAVTRYQNASSKEEKREMQLFINQLKGEFRTEISDNDPMARRLRTALTELEMLRRQTLLFAESAKERQARIGKENRFAKEAKALAAGIEAIKANKVLESAFEWRFEFPEVLGDDGAFVGFDAILGNPPYGVSIKGQEREYLVSSLKKVPDFEIYYWFINRSRQILRPEGVLGFIIPNSILFNVGAASYRKSLFEGWRLDEVLDCTDVSVFVDAVVRNAIITFTKTGPTTTLGYRNTKAAASFADLIGRPLLSIGREAVEAGNDNWGLLFKLDNDVLELVSKLRTLPKLDAQFQVSQGYIPYRKSDLIATYGEVEGTAIVKERMWHAATKVDAGYIEELWGQSLSKYAHQPTGSFVKYGSHVAGYVDLKFFNQKRLLVREITNPTVIATLVKDTFVNDPQIISIIPGEGECSLECLWGILNSTFAAFYHFNASPKATKGLFPKILVRDVKQFPMPSDEKRDDMKSFAGLVASAIATKAADPNADVEELEDKINKAVFDLYGLSAGERDVVHRWAQGIRGHAEKVGAPEAEAAA